MDAAHHGDECKQLDSGRDAGVFRSEDEGQERGDENESDEIHRSEEDGLANKTLCVAVARPHTAGANAKEFGIGSRNNGADWREAHIDNAIRGGVYASSS